MLRSSGLVQHDVRLLMLPRTRRRRELFVIAVGITHMIAIRRCLTVIAALPVSVPAILYYSI